MNFTVESFGFSERFKKEFARLDEGTRDAVREALELLQINPRAGRLRCHPLAGFGRPMIWKIDVYSNKSYQITFEVIGRVAHLKRIATHAQIDRNPRG